MAQNISQWSATGTFSNASQSDVTALATWSVSDSTIATVGINTGVITIQGAGKVYGGDIGVTASLAPGTPGTGSIIVVASDSGSVAPRMPQQDNHWVALGLSPWGSYGGCQEPTGSLVLSGSAPYTLTPVNAAANLPVTYAQTNQNWTRVGVGMTGSATIRFAAAAGVGPNPATDSMALLAYIAAGPSTAAAQIFGLGAAASAGRIVMIADSNANSSGQIDINFNANVRRMTGPLTNQHSDRIHPLLIVYNRTLNEVWGFSDQCLTMSGSSPAQVDGTKMFGGNNAVSCSGTMVYWASCTGSVAESYGSVQGGGNLLQALGWNVPWLNCAIDSGTIRCPTTPTCWQVLGLRPWSAAYNLQEVTGSSHSFDVWQGTLVGGWTMSPALNMTYRNAVPGWLRRSINFPEIASARIGVTNNLIGSYTGSAAFLGYSKIDLAAGANRVVLGGFGAALGAQFRVQFGIPGIPELNCSGTVTTGINSHVDGRAHPFLAVYDVTNSRAKLYTDIEAITGSFGVLNVTPTIGMGAIISGQTAASASNLYFAVCTGSVAEALSDNGRASQFLKTLGWNLTW